MSMTGEFVIKDGVLKKYIPAEGVTCVTVPEDVHTIGTGAFKSCDTLTEIVFPNSVQKIKDLAFMHCGNLREMTLPESVTEVGFGAFFCCVNLEKLCLPKGIRIAKASAFWASEDQVISDPRVSVFPHAFDACIRLKKLIAPGICEVDKTFVPMDSYGGNKLELAAYVMPEADLTLVKNTKIKQALVLGYLSDMEEYTNHEEYRKLVCAQRNAMLPIFVETDNVAAITILAEEKKITAKNYDEIWNLANEANATQIKAYLLSWKNQAPKAKTAGKEFQLEQKEKPLSLTALKKIWAWEEVSEGCVQLTNYKGKDTHLVIPATIRDFKVVGVKFDLYKRNAHLGLELESLEISAGIQTIGDHCFASCDKLQRVILADTVTKVEPSAFRCCRELTQVSGTGAVTRLGRNAFELCGSLSGDLFLQNLARVEAFTVSRCDNELNIHLSEKAAYIDDFAFSRCSKITIYAPAGSYAETWAKEKNIPFVAK